MNLNRVFRRSSSQLITLKVWPIRTVLVCMMLSLAGWAMTAQEQAPPTDTNYDFVSGTITELPPGKIVVNRAVRGKPPEDRTFLITGETKIEGTLKTNAPVTVGFKPTEEGDVAMRIIVRAATPAPKKP
jgi:hypothetical protein